MLKRKALRKIFITTFSIFTLLVIYLIPTKINNQYLNSDIEVEYTSNTTNGEIYLLGDNNYLVKTKIFLESTKLEDQIKEILSYLMKDSNKKLPTGLNSILPSGVTVKNVTVDRGLAVVNFSKELLEVDEKVEERMIEGIIYSITALPSIEKVSIQVEGESLTSLPKTKKTLEKELTRDFGINKVYDITNRNGIQKVTVYYLSKIANNNYYVPVTKYLNDDREKIKIIIDNLASSYIYEPNLMSYLSSQTTILDFNQEDNIFFLDLNQAVLGKDNILEEVEYTLGYSIFENYDVDKIMLKVEGNVIKEITK